jgi:hypothetical protein
MELGPGDDLCVIVSGVPEKNKDRLAAVPGNLLCHSLSGSRFSLPAPAEHPQYAETGN